MSNRVPQLLPTSSIKDADTRAFCDALVNAWQLRNGDIGHNDDERFITKKEFAELANDPGLNLLLGKSGMTGLATANKPSTTGTVADFPKPSANAERLLERIRVPITLVLKPNLDRLWAGLNALDAKVTREITTSVSGSYALAKVVNKLWAVIGSNTGSIIEDGYLATATPSAAEATAWTALVSRVGQAESGILTETSTRSTKDTALARAINTIWATVGSNTSLIEDGALASSGQTAATASKWTQVQAEVIGPNGEKYVSAVRQDFDAYADSTTGILNASYVLRINANGVIAGFGIATDGNTSSFVVNANEFYITPSTTSLAQAPFQVSGNLVKINTAFIADGTITWAKIEDTISSSNYVYNTSGWRIISSTGNAYFNNIYARGDIRASSLTANTVYTSNIVGSQITKQGSSSGTNPSVTISTPNGYSSVFAIASGATHWYDDGNGNAYWVSDTVTLSGEVSATGLGTVGASTGENLSATSVTVSSSSTVSHSLAVFVGLR